MPAPGWLVILAIAAVILIVLLDVVWAPDEDDPGSFLDLLASSRPWCS